MILHQEPLCVARALADRWIREDRFRWLIYHTNITHHGLLLLADATGEQRYARHVREAWDWYRAEKAAELESPDFHMHTFGIVLAELVLRGEEPGLAPLARRRLEALRARQPRAPDGAFTFRDQDVVFVDSLAGTIPFLARAGALFGEMDCFDEACRQVATVASRLRHPSTGLYVQGEGIGIFPDWPSEGRRRTEGAWARGNGWMMLALVELLSFLPLRHAGRDRIVAILADFVSALLPRQDETGMWRQILDREDAYPEVSGTALFAFGLARAVRKGWLPRSLAPRVEKAVAALSHFVEDDGTIRNVCIGTPFQRSEQAYFALPAPVNDLHGHGPVILACAELAAMRG